MMPIGILAIVVAVAASLLAGRIAVAQWRGEDDYASRLLREVAGMAATAQRAVSRLDHALGGQAGVRESLAELAASAGAGVGAVYRAVSRGELAGTIAQAGQDLIAGVRRRMDGVSLFPGTDASARAFALASDALRTAAQELPPATGPVAFDQVMASIAVGSEPPPAAAATRGVMPATPRIAVIDEDAPRGDLVALNLAMEAARAGAPARSLTGVPTGGPVAAIPSVPAAP